MWFGQAQGQVYGQWWGDGVEGTTPSLITASLSGAGFASGTLTAVVEYVAPPMPVGGRFQIEHRIFPALDAQDEEEIALILAVLEHLEYL